ncbi:MAG TPA: MbnP family protein [Polyangiaceae bacterium]
MGCFDGNRVLAASFLWVLAASAGCGGKASAPGNAGAAASASGAATSDVGGATSDVGGGGVSGAQGCPETPQTLQAAGTVVTFQTDPFLGGQAMIYGQPNALPDGATLTPLDFRFYISNVGLIRQDGSRAPVDLVTGTGTLEPYGVHLFNAEDATSTAWSIRAEPGSYNGLELTLGLVDGCNAGDQSQRQAPLSAASQMTWSAGFGYLFLVFEARIEGGTNPMDGGTPSSDGGLAAPFAMIRMGGFPGLLFAPVVHVDGPLAVPRSGPVSRHMRLDMQQLFDGAASMDPGDPPNGPVPPIPSAIEGEQLRRAAPRLPIFVLEP